jgi:dUTP pyrophosphatase
VIIEIEKVRESVKTPERANPSDAGLDVFFNPSDGKKITIFSNENKLLPIGCKFGVPHGYMLQVCNRSSIAAKKELVVGAHIIDAGYDGEVFIDLHNIGADPQTISPGDKIAQLIMVPVIHFRVRESRDLYEETIVMSDRGDGALGSTDTKSQHSPTKDKLSRLVRAGWMPNGF